MRTIQNFDPSRVTSKVAGEVVDFDPSNVLDRKEIRRNDRYTQFALVADARGDGRRPGCPSGWRASWPTAPARSSALGSVARAR